MERPCTANTRRSTACTPPPSGNRSPARTPPYATSSRTACTSGRGTARTSRSAPGPCAGTCRTAARGSNGARVATGRARRAARGRP
ncbi:hypothetical protein B0T18DRAFT_402968 [Schizothecium vesticola]|uniref:Uncharacterized protein n=1 Tax=Schizothecium vesticola TaxID=314040 RepID=A0AA40KAE9_9PEZI|nr:hypothetical protein B0T18DRAFT_402968 [Schizothecium vesticola]